MTTTQAPAPTITNAGTRPKTSHKLFVNIPVSDIQRSITFFESLGFAFNPQFTDATSTCMLVGEDAYFMLLNTERFTGFAKGPIGDPRQQTSALFALSVESREEVDAMVQQAVTAGGIPATDKQDHGFMYGWGFTDLDGHRFEVFWMDPKALQG
jgi:predicted lactoylglutathione lyase